MPAGSLGIRLFCLAGAYCGLLCAQWDGETGRFFSRGFTPAQYGASPQNWAATQGTNGIMYFANTGGILEFDGVTWHRIPAAGRGVRSLAVDQQGTIFAGGLGDFGYLAPDPLTGLKFVSLLSKIPADARKFADVWSIAIRGTDVYFGSYQAIFRWSPAVQGMRVWKPRETFGRLIPAGGELYVVSRGQGLLQLRGDEWAPVAGGEAFDAPDVRAIYAGRDGIELATRTALYRYDGAAFTPIPSPAAGLLKDSLIATVKLLNDGTRLVATARGGLIVLSPDAATWRVYTRIQGQLSDSLTDLFLDREGGLWITSGAGMERLVLSLTRFGRSEGLNASVYSVARYQGLIYAATETGLFMLRPGSEPRLETVKGLSMPVIPVIGTAHGILAGASGGILGTSGGPASLISVTGPTYDITLSNAAPNIAYAVGVGGLFRLRWGGSHWSMDRKLVASGTEFRAVAEDNDGRVWVATQGAILRVDWRKPAETVETFAVDKGVPGGFKNLFRIDGKVIAATSAGALQFSDSTGGFVPWTVLPAKPVSIIREAADHSLWVTGEGYHGILHRHSDGTSQWQPMPLLASGAAELYAVTPEADGTVWAAGAEGFLMRYSPALVPPAPAFTVSIRQVQSQAGLTAFAGSGTPTAPHLPYQHNTLRIEFAAPFFEDPGKVEYKVRLDGADTEWSKWTTETHRDFTHLFEGGYRFQVRARNPQGGVSRSEAYRFTIIAPWYRSWWAWMLYGASGLGAVWGFVQWRVAKLEQEKAQLEVIIEERTVEIREQRDQIQLEEERSQALLLNILPAAVASELKATGTVHPQHYDEVTVCFTDFVGFTLSSEQMPAEALVSSLHEYFTCFDEAVTQYGLEKLKTIGDAYMFAGGLPQPRASHAVDAVLAALRMVEVVAGLASRGEGAVWSVRIGLHSGPVSAGVVGVRKFAFDIWGNTVNLASRMESSGAPGEVNISARTFELVKDFFDCEARGLVQTKDRREREMYFVRKLRPELAETRAFICLYRESFGFDPIWLVKSSDPAQL